MKPQNLHFLLLLLMLFACQSDTKPTESPKEVVTQQEKIPASPTSTPQASIEADRTPDDYRNENWRPEEGSYFFSESWTWEFYNEMLPTTDPKHKGTFTIYMDPPTGTILFNSSDSPPVYDTCYSYPQISS